MHGETNSRLKPNTKSIQNSMYKHKIAPYVKHNSDGSVSSITAESAVSLINIYCQSISKNMNFALTWILKEFIDDSTKLYQVLILIISYKKNILTEFS